MHFLLLGIGIIFGIYGLYRFFMNASVKQIAALFMVGGFAIICIALFYLAVTGRLPAALGLLAALWPLALSFWHKRKNKHKAYKTSGPGDTPSGNSSMTRSEALSLLGLDGNAGAEEIRAAYKRLIKKVHPDQEGSAGLAAKLNEARDILLPKDN